MTVKMKPISELTPHEALCYLDDIAHGRKMDYDPHDLKMAVEKGLKSISVKSFCDLIIFHDKTIAHIHTNTNNKNWVDVKQMKVKDLEESEYQDYAVCSFFFDDDELFLYVKEAKQ